MTRAYCDYIVVLDDSFAVLAPVGQPFYALRVPFGRSRFVPGIAGRRNNSGDLSLREVGLDRILPLSGDCSLVRAYVHL